MGSVFGEFASFGPFALDRSMPDAEATEKLRELYGDAAAEKLPALFREAYPGQIMLKQIWMLTVRLSCCWRSKWYKIDTSGTLSLMQE